MSELRKASKVTKEVDGVLEQHKKHDRRSEKVCLAIVLTMFAAVGYLLITDHKIDILTKAYANIQKISDTSTIDNPAG